MEPKLDRERFEKFVYPDPNSGCFIWAGATNNWGYGSIGAGNGRTMLAHRYAWLLAGKSLPPGLFLMHRCDMPWCVNPDHLFLGTHTDNMRDMAAKRRGTRGSLPRGVYPVPGCPGRFAARLNRNGAARHLGTFASAEAAERAEVEARGRE